MQKAVVFGAGNIGRGFIGHLLSASGFETILVDVVPDLINELNRRRWYPLRIVTNEQVTDVIVDNVSAIDSRDAESVAVAISESSVVFTAVGAAALKYIAGPLALGIQRRIQTSGDALNVIICENLIDADARLRSLVLDHVRDGETRTFVQQQVGFVMASVGRMVPVISTEARDGDELRLIVEPYSSLPVDADALVGTLPSIRGVKAVRPFAYQIQLKLYCHNCGHAIAAYLGYLKGLEHIYECMDDTEVRSAVADALSESARALSAEHGISIGEIDEHIDDLLVRFANRRLSDTVIRVGRDPVRKLAAQDRLVGAARLAEVHGIEPKALARGIAAALRFDPEHDAEAQKLQNLIASKGVADALAEVSQIRRGEHLFELVMAEYDRLRS